MILHEFPRRYHELRAVLRDRYETEEANSVARILLEAVTGISWRDWQLHPDRPWEAIWDQAIKDGVVNLLAGRPVQHIIGYTIFYDRIFSVSPDALIPRQETEELVHWALASVKTQAEEPIRFLDIGTGSGCIAVTLEREWAVRGISTEAFALEVSEGAFHLAQKNARDLHSKVSILQEDIFASTTDQFSGLDLVISNPPYVTQSDKLEMDALVLDHDPELALFAPEEDALAFYRVIAHRAKEWLRPGGYLMLEFNEAFGEETANVVREAGFSEIELRKDLNGKDRMVRGKWEEREDNV